MLKTSKTNLSGEYINTLIEKSGMTLEQIAEKANTNYSQISNWRRGGQPCGNELALKIGEVLGADKEKLLSFLKLDKASRKCKRIFRNLPAKEREKLIEICFDK